MDDYKFQNVWMMVKARGTITKEVVTFLETTFMIMEIRERVGEIRDIKFEIRTKEGNHVIWNCISVTATSVLIKSRL